jgi:hypothetical protein
MERDDSEMGWLIMIIVVGAPIFDRIHRRLTDLEQEVKTLKGMIEQR